MNAQRLALVLVYANGLQQRLAERRRQSPTMQAQNAGDYRRELARR